MTPERRGRIAAGAFIGAVVLSAIGLWIDLTTHNPNVNDEWGLPGFEGILALSFASVGLIVGRRSTNPVGWIFTLLGFASGVQYLTEEYASAGLLPASDLPAATYFAWIAEWIWVPLIAAVGALVLIFPDERIDSKGRRVILGAIVFTGLCTVAVAAFYAPTIQTFQVANPFTLNSSEARYETVFTLVVSSMMLSIVAAAGSLVGRLVHSRGVRRQQLKWFSYAALFASVSLVFGAIPATMAVGSKFSVAGLVLIAVACGVAILKYRLYDIDVIINRTLVYGALTASLLALYLLVVVTLSRVLDPITRDSDVAVAASTLAVAALFRPLRSRIQAFIDRRFYRRKYDSVQALDGFASRLRDEIAIEAVRTDVLGVVGKTLQPAHVSLWINGGVQ
ncbi:MAG: hypothetical protein ABR505_02955 [Actinomycetota bacterium]